MECICHCAAKAWRLVMRTHDAASTAWLEGLGLTDLPTPTCDGEVRRYEGPWEVATALDPLVEVDLWVDSPAAGTVVAAGEELQRGVAIATGTLAGKTITISNRPPAISPEVMNACGDAIRVATPEQVFRLALHWFIALDHLGCVDLDKSAFFGSYEVIAYAVDQAWPWVESGLPLPMPGSVPEDRLVLFLGWEGSDLSFSHFSNAIDLLEASRPAATLIGGIYPGDVSGERCLVGIGRCTDGGRGHP